ncbi:TPA: hypothetical protein EYP27_01720 [Candidatus Bathyarchaeota archaeon]|nr:hypothetical protein [Candidatus Bathyarchaeota archaeon]
MEDAQILEILKRSGEDSKWVSENYDEFQSKYEGKILAIKNKNIVCEADTMEELLNKLEERGENVGLLLIESVPPRNISFIL